MKKRNNTTLPFLFISLFYMPLYGSSLLLMQPQVGQQESKTNEGFVENTGQIVDQFGNPNEKVKFLLNLKDRLKVQLRADGFSYELLNQSTSGAIISERIDIHFFDPHASLTISKENVLYNTIRILITKSFHQMFIRN